jgi:hypothetical protein
VTLTCGNGRSRSGQERYDADRQNQGRLTTAMPSELCWPSPRLLPGSPISPIRCPDEIWGRDRHFDEQALAGLVPAAVNLNLRTLCKASSGTAQVAGVGAWPHLRRDGSSRLDV